MRQPSPPAVNGLERVRRWRVRREGTSGRRGDRVSGLRLQKLPPYRHRRACGGCGNANPFAPRVGTEWPLARHVRWAEQWGQPIELLVEKFVSAFNAQRAHHNNEGGAFANPKNTGLLLLR